jgi:hypothetical protein
MEYSRDDVNLLVEHYRSTPDADKADEFVKLDPQRRYDYLVALRDVVQSDVAPRKKALLWNISRKLMRIDQEMRRAGR